MRPITSSGIPRTTSVTSRLPSKLWNFHVPLSYICLLLASITTVAVAADTSKDFDGGEEVGQRETLIINFYPEKLSLFQFKSEDIAISFQVNSTQGEAQDQVLENGESDVEKPAWLQCPGELNIAADSAVHLRAINGTFNVTPDDFRNEENFTITLRANNLGYAYLIITWTSLVPLEQCQQALQSAALNFKSLSPAQPKLIATQNGTGLTDYMTKAQNTLEVLNEDSINEEISEDDDGGDDDDEEGEEEEHTTTTPKTTLKKSKKKSKKPKKTVESLDYSSYLKRSEQMSQTQVNQISLVTYDFSKNGTEYRYQVIIYRDTGAVDMLFVILVTVCVAVNTLFMGCQIDLKVIIQVLKKPIGPAVGYVSQFVFMPVVSPLF